MFVADMVTPMPLDPRELAASEDAYRITSPFTGHKLRVATMLNRIALSLVSDDPHELHTFAEHTLEELQHRLDELKRLRRVGETASFCNGHDAVIGGR